MGVCESKANIPRHISQHSLEQQLSESNKAETTKLRAANHNDLIDKAKSVIDKANSKIQTLQDRCAVANDRNESLTRELAEIQEKQFEKDEITKQYKEELDVQRETMIKWKSKIQSLSEEIQTIEQERKMNDTAYKSNLLSIADSLYKVHGDNVSKLKFNKMSKKFVVFIDKINHLFYYDENGPKYMKIKDISIENESIQKQMNWSWFLVVGERRSALFVAESKATRDKWMHFISKSLGKNTAKDDLYDDSQSISVVNPLFSVDNKLEKEMNAKLDKKKTDFGQSQSPINIITITAPKHDEHHHHKAMVLKDEDFSGNALKFNYPEKIKRCTIINNGHTVQVNIPSSAKCKLWIYEKEFELKQFHFHTPSEHTIDGRAYECEMHLVHMNEANEICVLGFIFTTGQKYEKPRLQLTKSRAHLILAQKDSKDARVSDMRDDEEESDDLETDDEWQEDESRDKEDGAKKGNDFLSQFFDELPPQKTDQEILLKKSLSFDFLFETASKSMSRNVKTNEVEINMEIFEYMGSLTTPPYTEGVQWLLSKTTHFINEKQLQALSACWGNENNARPVQKYFGRQVSLRSKSSLRVAT